MGESTLGRFAASPGWIVAVLFHLIGFGVTEGEHVIDEFVPHRDLAVIRLSARHVATVSGQAVGIGVIVVDEIVAHNIFAVGKGGQAAIDLHIVAVTLTTVFVTA